MWPFRTFWVVMQPSKSKGSGDTVLAVGSTSREKGRGHFSNFGVSVKCVTNQILFLVIEIGGLEFSSGHRSAYKTTFSYIGRVVGSFRVQASASYSYSSLW